MNNWLNCSASTTALLCFFRLFFTQNNINPLQTVVTLVADANVREI